MKRFICVFTVLLGLGMSSMAQGIRVSGNVIAQDDGLPLPGVCVMEKGTKNGVMTDLDGNYTLVCESSDPTLVFSMIGFKTKEITVGNMREIDVALETDWDSTGLVTAGFLYEGDKSRSKFW